MSGRRGGSAQGCRKPGACVSGLMTDPRERRPAAHRGSRPRSRQVAATLRRCWAGGADSLGETAQPVHAGREDDVADAGGEARASRGVGVAKGTVAHKRLDATPFAAGGNAWVHLAAWFAGAGAVAHFCSRTALRPRTKPPVESRVVVGCREHAKAAQAARETLANHEDGRPRRIGAYSPPVKGRIARTVPSPTESARAPASGGCAPGDAGVTAGRA